MSLINKSFPIKAVVTATLLVVTGSSYGFSETKHVSDEVISEQRKALATNTKEAGFGPQSPRDIDVVEGNNNRAFGAAPAYTEMNLCNIHFHENAEHKGGEFTKHAGNGNGQGYGAGYAYSGDLSAAELKKIDIEIGVTEHGDLVPGDTIEVHYVYSTAKVKPGPTLGSCLSDAIKNPQVRVEAQIYVLVNDDNALNFMELTKLDVKSGYHQAINIPNNTGTTVQYDGSTTGPGYNEKGSPFHVTWSVRPKVAKVNIKSVDEWLKNNIFDENHAHGVRNLVINTDLLSPIKLR